MDNEPSDLGAFAIMLLGIPVGLFILYLFVWAMAYPVLGYRCLKYDTVQTAEIHKTGAWGTSYKVSYTDGMEDVLGGEVYIGKEICRDSTADFPW